jgi:hypothetical protein
MYSLFVRQWIRVLGNAERWLDKASAFADAKKVDPKVLLGSRLAPDQFPFTKQIQIMTDVAKGAAARLAGQEPPKFDDNEQTVEDLRARLRKTVAYLEGVKPEALNGGEARLIPIPHKPGKGLPGAEYLQQWAQPNFYFHATTAYAILRHNGVELGKSDYLGDVSLRSL